MGILLNAKYEKGISKDSFLGNVLKILCTHIYTHIHTYTYI